MTQAGGSVSAAPSNNTHPMLDDTILGVPALTPDSLLGNNDPASPEHGVMCPGVEQEHGAGERYPDTYVIVPAYNEGPVIHGVARSLCREFRNVVVVNDGSTDSTPDALHGLAITVLSHAVNLGQGAAIQTGVTYALSKGAHWVVTFDSDGQHRPEDAKRMVSHIRRVGADAVFGSRFLGATNAPRTRRALLKLAVWFSNATTGTRLTDAHNGLRVLSRKAAGSLHITHNGMAHASQILSQLTEARIPIVELPVTIDYTEYSMKKGQSASNAVDILLELLIGRLVK